MRESDVACVLVMALSAVAATTGMTQSLVTRGSERKHERDWIPKECRRTDESCSPLVSPIWKMLNGITNPCSCLFCS